jgi:hypothetical protein
MVAALCALSLNGGVSPGIESEEPPNRGVSPARESEEVPSWIFKTPDVPELTSAAPMEATASPTASSATRRPRISSTRGPTTSSPGPKVAPKPVLVFNNIGITDDSDTSVGNWDGGGATFSRQALAASGVNPGGSLSHDGLTFTWPAQAGTGSPDNVIAVGQTVNIVGKGKLGFLVSASYGPAIGTGTVHYTDGSSSLFTLGSQDWFTDSGSPGAMVISSAYQNRPNNTRYDHGGFVYCVSVILVPGKTMSSVTLPTVGVSPVAAGTPTLHVFAIAASNA